MRINVDFTQFNTFLKNNDDIYIYCQKIHFCIKHFQKNALNLNVNDRELGQLFKKYF